MNIDVDDESERVHVQFLIVYIVLAVVSFFMTAVNIITKWKFLAYICFVFAILCIVDIFIELPKKSRTAGRIIFSLEIIALFTSFLIIGEPEGFSVLWMLLLPSCGFFLFRLKYGLVVSGTQLMLILLFLWIPAGREFLRYDYTDTFIMRFPIVYLAFSVLGIILELVRMNAQNQVTEARERYKYMYNHDALTGLYNRYGFNSTMDEFVARHRGKAFSFAILDLDKFKDVNDTYGHLNGDVVLKETSRITKNYFAKDGNVCRWGGEEFSILLDTCADPDARFWGLLGIARTNEIVLSSGEKLCAVFSMGVVNVQANQNVKIGELVRQADDNLYKAKENGRNQIVSSVYKEQ